MYQILCDGFEIYDARDESLIVSNPKCNLEVNTVGEASFSIYSNHPYYSMLQKLRSVFEIKQGNEVIFRGRMTDDSKDFRNMKTVDIEGAMAYFNDSVIRPFSFPEDFLEDAGYIAAENKVKFFLNWLITQHNSQVKDFQKFKLGNVTVKDANNYILRSNEDYASTWETLKSKLFDSELGGYLCIRYEADGNYIDYLSDFEYTNVQKIKYGENLLDLKNDSDASETYSAILPLGAKIEAVTDSTEEGTETTETAKETRLTLESLEDGEIVDDVVKAGDILYSKSAVDSYGFILAPTSATTWDDVTEASNLKSKAIEYLKGDAIKLKNTVEIKAVDLNFTDEEIAAFRIYRYVEVDSVPHEHQGRYKLTKLEIDLMNPQNTQIQLGETRYSLHDSNYNKFQNANVKIESTKNELKSYVSSVTKGLSEKIEGIEGTYFYIKYSQFEDGHVMTDIPDGNTAYMGTCNTNKETAPTDYTLYTWVKVKGDNGAIGPQGEQGSKGETGPQGPTGAKGETGADGKTQYLHIKYSDDGSTFTENNGETLGAWIGTLVDFNETDSNIFSDYTWKKFTEDVDDELADIRTTIVEQATEITNTCSEIIMSAMSSYVEINQGVTVSGITKYYLATSSNSNVSIDGSGWTSDSIPALTSTNCYLWCYEQLLHSDNRITNTEPFILSTYTGAAIASITDYYGVNTNKERAVIEVSNSDGTGSTVERDLDWSTEIPSMSVNNLYLWNYSVIKYANSTTTETAKRLVDEYSYSYSELTEIVKSQLQILSDNISFNITQLTEQVSGVNEDLQSKFNEIKQYFTFDINGMTIGQSDSPCKVKIDEDSIELSLNDNPLLWMDVVTGETHTEKLTVTQELNLFGYKISKDDSENVNLEYVG